MNLLQNIATLKDIFLYDRLRNSLYLLQFVGRIFLQNDFLSWLVPWHSVKCIYTEKIRFFVLNPHGLLSPEQSLS
jgi:hypothetical protein